MNTHKNLQLFSTILRGITVITLVLTNFVGGFSISNVSAQTMTISIRDDATGGDCTTIGEWDSGSKTCSLTADLNNVVITIASDGVTLDGAGHVLSGDASTPKGIVVTEHSYVTLKRLKVTGYQTGISLFYANSNTIDGNSTYDNTSVGISVYSSHNNIVRNNISENNGSTGIRLDWSTYNTIQDNIASGHTGYPRGGVFIFSGTHHNTVENNSISDNYYGIYVHDSANSNTIQNNALTNNFYGVAVTASSNNLIQSNLASGNYAGIDLGSNARTNTIQQNEIIGGTWGISLNSSGAPTSSGSSDNVVTENTVSASSMAGIQIDRSVNNQIYRNNFLGSGAHNNDGSGNTFDAGLELGGNYWISYDEPSEGCTNANSDAYCDSPYLLPAGYQDNYPWARQNGWLNQPPFAEAGGPYTTSTGDSITLDASASSDPDGDVLTYEWDLDNDGQYNDAIGVTVTTTFSQAGEYTVGLRVTDMLGLEGTDTAIVTVADHAPNVSFAAHLPSNQVHAYNWTTGSTLTLTIDDPEIPGSPDFQGAEVVPDNDLYGNTWTVFELPEFELKPGQTMTITDNITTKTHVIRTVAVTSVNPDTDIITGTAESNTEVGINAHYNPGGDYVHRNIVSDENGIWMVDLSIPGPNPGEDLTYDIIGGSWGTAFQLDDDNDSTFYEWGVPKDPQVQVVLNSQEIHCSYWPFGAELTLTIDDPDNGVGVDYLTTHSVDQISDDETFALFTLRGQYEIQPGDIVMVTDGATTKQHTVYHLDLTSLDPETNVFTGTATPGQTVKAYTWGSQNGQCSTTVSGTGEWSINFSDPACEQPYDLQLGSEGALIIEDPNNTATQYFWRVADPWFFVWLNPSDGSLWDIHGYDWPLNTPITMTVDDPNTPESPDYTRVAYMEVPSWGGQEQLVYDVSGMTIHPGDIVTMMGGNIIRTHTVTSLRFGGINVSTDTVNGTAEPGSEVSVGLEGFDAWRKVFVAGDGTWVVDFSQPGDEGQEPFDIQPGMKLQIDQHNGGGATAYGVNVPNPRIFAMLGDQRVYAWGWPAGTLLTLTIENPATPQSPDYTGTQLATAFEDWDYGFEWGITLDVQPGYRITVSGGGITKELVVAPLTVTAVDMDADTVSGTGDPGFEIHVGMLCDDNGCTRRNVYVDNSGNWLADFSVPGNDEDETVFDIRPGSGTGVYQIDEDNDATNVRWNVPNPAFQVRANDDRVEGWEWTLGDTVTIQVDDPSTPQEVDYTGTALVGVADWDPNQTWFSVQTNNYDIKVGDIITVIDGNTIKQLFISDYKITEVDLNTDTVRGIAGPNQRVNIWTCWQNTPCVSRDETADGDGNWETNFAVPGEQDWEQETADLRAGSWIDSSVSDEDGDSVMFGWSVLNPRIEVLDYIERLALVDWPAGQTVHVSIDDPSTGPSPDHEQDFTPDQDGNYYEFFVAYDIKAGDIITATNGAITKTLEVAALQATEIDPDNGIVHGVAAPNSQFDVDVWGDHFDASPVHDVVSVDGSGEWSADYSDVPGNLLPWTWMIRGEMRQSDEDGDVIIANWHNHWGVLEVWMNEAELRAYDWELGTTLIFTVDDPTTYQPVDFMEEAQTIPMTWTNHGEATVSVRGKLNLQPGMTVTVTDGIKTKTTVIQNIGFNKLDAVNDIVGGFAPENADLDIAISKDYWSHRYFSADANGNWVVDYSIPDVAGRTLDLQPGDQFQGLLMRDEEFDSTVISGHVPNPSLSARLTENQVHGYDWLLGSDVTLSIDGNEIDTQTVVRADWDPNQTFVWFDLGESLTLQSGQVIEMTDGIVTKTHIVTNLIVSNVDASTDTVSGTASPDSQVDVGHIVCDENGCRGFRRVFADSNGDWIADFAHTGEDDDEQDIIDITPGMGSEARQCDDDGDCTQYGWWIANPVIVAFHSNNGLGGDDWPRDLPVTVTIDDPTNGAGVDFTDTQLPGDRPWAPNGTWIEFDLNGFDLQPGALVIYDNGQTTKLHTVMNLTITSIDLENDTLSGTADPGSEIQVWVDTPFSSMNRYTNADINGIWSVDYSVPGSNSDEQSVIDITAGTGGQVKAYDEDGDSTQIGWQVPNPNIRAITNEDRVDGWQWIAGATAILSIDDPGTPQNPDYTNEGTVGFDEGNGQTYVDIGFGGDYDLKPGDVVTLTDGAITKTVTATNVTVANVDVNTNVVTGTAEPGSEVWSAVCQYGNCFQRTTTTDFDGNWSIDFDEEVLGQPNVDVVPGGSVDGEQFDEDGDSTLFIWYIPNPRVSARLPHQVRGDGWTLGTSVTLTIDDPADGPDVDYSATNTVTVADWNPDQTMVDFDMPSGFEIEPGFVVTLTDGIVTKTTIAVLLTISNIDVNTDTVSGTADSGANVIVWTDGAIRRVIPGQDGNWAADFSIPGGGDDEQNTMDILPGAFFMAWIQDEDGDDTTVWNEAPSPTISAFPVGDSINGHNWPTGMPLQIEIDDPATPVNPDFEGQATDWDPNVGAFQMIDFHGQYDMRPGDIVTVTNGTITKTHIVKDFLITEIDVNTDIVSGLAEPGSDIVSWICDDYGCAERYTMANQDGNWSADFSVLGNDPADWGTYDFKPGTGVEASQADEDGDRTVVAMDLPNPYVQASAQSDWVLANGWTEGMTVTLTINDIQYGSAVMGPASWNPGRIVGEFELGGYNIQVGDVVVVEGGGVTRNLTVSMLQVLNVDPVEDTVSGVASSGSLVEVCANPHNGCTIKRWDTAEGGVWSVDFDDEFDLVAGSDGWAAELEEDGDGTWYDWYVPAVQYAPFVVFGQEGAWIKENTDVISGDVAANVMSEGPYLTDQSEVTIGQDVHFMDTSSRVIGDTVYLKQGSQVYDIYANQLKGNGQILGVFHTPLALPVVAQLPIVPDVNPGTQNFDLKKNSTLTLDAGSYGKLETKKGAVITFTGGIYHFSEWSLGDDVKVYFAAPTEIRIADKLDIGSNAFIGPANGTNLTARDILIYVMGENGKKGKINNSPKAANFGMRSTLIANVYVPNGTLWIHERSNATGAFFGLWVVIGQKVTLTLENGWR